MALCSDTKLPIYQIAHLVDLIVKDLLKLLPKSFDQQANGKPGPLSFLPVNDHSRVLYRGLGKIQAW